MVTLSISSLLEEIGFNYTEFDDGWQYRKYMNGHYIEYHYHYDNQNYVMYIFKTNGYLDTKIATYNSPTYSDVECIMNTYKFI